MMVALMGNARPDDLPRLETFSLFTCLTKTKLCHEKNDTIVQTEMTGFLTIVFIGVIRPYGKNLFISISY
jgi:hypothetical protein